MVYCLQSHKIGISNGKIVRTRMKLTDSIAQQSAESDTDTVEAIPAWVKMAARQ
jgi:hypothetical protein